ncbi:MAG: recombination factor protein RarA [Gammaproteobacteria bacterium RIFCSPLOWO2_02_FULL_42_14]|nr:MAG: recombination factor protein RarA [Gammaproteobacteria bacterium RIFCSPHIGHO2_02_FULL_42_43]OGT28398.1 MAG: recombination factor protein RarA [Gammaproteobacteria bacterium RIFCSPHIGHO2_01_FULL_42_8]OGT51606.1 MAG: recombination factor protein RarA [Gammaproteobacteria bacterium RIFCSPHIGHO2_12_FULL_41_25]OGT62305.1 MAG: recombination factor protein RarA [Gammaproteobacteria bacterium RIFCSPLOWO2_02_FULL_42_14]OGT85980.1 MAG: recombination factor protein RarA [Gammaproteobacteria bacter
MRPASLAQFAGQSHLLSAGKPLFLAIEQHKLHSMILWGPPGVGKTALAELIAESSAARIERLSAVLSGVKEIREVIARAESHAQKTVLFVDEVHRFNTAQQDAFLPHIEQGTITFIGATTENPSFHLNNALLSRARVYVLKSLSENDLLTIINQTISDQENGYGNFAVDFNDTLKQQLVNFVDGDARFCLNILEILFDFAKHDDQKIMITPELLQSILTQNQRRFDKGGDAFYDQISALHKSVRGSDPDAALYWFSRMIDGGCDPHYLARRIVRMATEDIGNADPRALTIALDAWEAFDRLGSPEGELALAQAVVFLSVAPKSNATYLAYQNAQADVEKFGSLDVPLHLRNAPTKLMKALDYGKNYRYAHDEKDAIAVGENYFPEKMGKKIYYEPVPRGLEIQIGEKLKKLRTNI